MLSYYLCLHGYFTPIYEMIKQGTVGSAFELEGGTLVLVEDGTFYEGVDDFCYLGDRISAGGGADAAVLARIRSGWAKFNELVPVICGSTMSNKLKGQVYTAFVRSVILYGRETWPMRKDLEDKLDKTEMKMIRWMAGVSVKDRKRNQDLRDEFGIDSILNRGHTGYYLTDNSGSKVGRT